MTKDLTTGKIQPLLIGFTIPLVLGNIFQLTYNAIDSIIVGRFVGKEALAAVGTSNPLMTLAILFINGMCLGAGVLIGQLYGAKEDEKLKRQISTTFIAGSIFSLIISLLFIAFAPQIFWIMQVEEAVRPMAVSYMRIIFLGLIFTFLYNFYASTLRALGDSKSPLYFLIISSIINIFGDLFFVVILNWGSEGCAISTVVSEAISCLMCNIYIRKKIKLLDLKKQWFVFDRELFKTIVSYGWAGAMQQATVQLGKLGIQSLVNSMGVSVMAAFSAVNRIDDFVYTPQQNIGHAMTSVMAQNKGAGKIDRVRDSFKIGIRLELIYAAILCAACLIFSRPLMLLFTTDETVIAHGVTYLKLISFMYFLPALTNGIQGFFRGVGQMKVTLHCSLINMGVRVLSAVLIVWLFKIEIEALPFSYMWGWLAMLAYEVPLLWKGLKKLKA